MRARASALDRGKDYEYVSGRMFSIGEKHGLRCVIRGRIEEGSHNLALVPLDMSVLYRICPRSFEFCERTTKERKSGCDVFAGKERERELKV